MQEKTKDTRLCGIRGEEMAANYLKENGYFIVERNYRTKIGEIDIIAMKAGILYFFEVKTRGKDRLIDPLEAVTPAKMRRIRRTAEYYLMCNRSAEKKPCSFGVIGIDDSREPPKIECILDAFE